jgi:hypothetical protein
VLKLLISFDAADWHSSCCLHALSYYLVGGTMNKKLAFLFGMIMLAAPSSANALLISGTPTPFGQPASPTPIFGTLLDFDDGTTGTDLLFDRYLAFGITSISNTLGPSLGFHPTSQSAPNYIGTGFPNGWDADILVEFTTLQAAVGIGIAGPTTLQFELLDASMNVLEGYSLSTTPINTYYFINRLSADTKFLRVAGDFVAIDDLQFDNVTVPQSIPEPSTLALFGAGLAGLALIRRCRKFKT